MTEATTTRRRWRLHRPGLATQVLIGFLLGVAASTGATLLINSLTTGTKWPIVVSLPAALAATEGTAT